jgi:hypothetical protein
MAWRTSDCTCVRKKMCVGGEEVLSSRLRHVCVQVGLGAAAQIATDEGEATTAHIQAMRDRLQDRLLRALPQVRAPAPCTCLRTCALSTCLLIPPHTHARAPILPGAGSHQRSS